VDQAYRHYITRIGKAAGANARPGASSRRTSTDFDGLRQRGLRRLPPRRAVDAGGAAEAGAQPRGPRCSISPVSLELGYLTFCLFPINSVAFLDLSNELIALPFDDLPVIVGQSFTGLHIGGVRNGFFWFLAQFSRAFGRREFFSRRQQDYRCRRFRVLHKREFWGEGDLWEITDEEISRTAIYTKSRASHVIKIGLVETRVSLPRLAARQEAPADLCR
jgi:hypothetical protein